MKIQYLGTAAFEGVPAIFCECEICKRSLEEDGKNIRTRSQAIIDNTILVDFPADTYIHFVNNKLPLTDIKTCIVTHSHEDHLYPIEILSRKKGYSLITDIKPMTFYSDKSAYEILEKTITENQMTENEVQNKLIEVFVPFYADGYKITPLRAEHDHKSTPVIFLIERDGKCILYGNDTGDFPKETWEYLENLDIKIDLVSLDCTAGWLDCECYGHMNFKECIETRKKLFDMGVVHKDTVFVINHFSHNGLKATYEELVPIVEKEGFLISYDGMIVEV